jgi:hypothetical protein
VRDETGDDEQVENESMWKEEGRSEHVTWSRRSFLARLPPGISYQ